MFTLYNAPQSTCSQRVRFVLNAKRLPFAEVKLDLLAGDQLAPEYLKLNPLGCIPTFVGSNGFVLTETMAIAIYCELQSTSIPDIQDEPNYTISVIPV